jgi:hypothetical protein
LVTEIVQHQYNSYNRIININKDKVESHYYTVLTLCVFSEVDLHQIRKPDDTIANSFLTTQRVLEVLILFFISVSVDFFYNATVNNISRVIKYIIIMYRNLIYMDCLLLIINNNKKRLRK